MTEIYKMSILEEIILVITLKIDNKQSSTVTNMNESKDIFIDMQD